MEVFFSLFAYYECLYFYILNLLYRLFSDQLLNFINKQKSVTLRQWTWLNTDCANMKKKKKNQKLSISSYLKCYRLKNIAMRLAQQCKSVIQKV